MLAINCKGIEQHFGTVTAVDGVDLQIEAGTVTALLGPNGAGKTTLLDVVLGLTQPTRGTAELFGCHRVTPFPAAWWVFPSRRWC